VLQLHWAKKKDIEDIKSARWDKLYRVTITAEKRGKLNEAVCALRGCSIHQRTPSRVSHRRADKVRIRRIHDIYIEDSDMDATTLVVKAESGTYIKELITGDEGRTVPSLSEIAETALEVKELDVIGIGDENGKKVKRHEK
jgi:tRNA pseudouridine synthase 10